MFCPQCGANNAEAAVVCVQCGRNLQAAAPAAPLQVSGTVQPPVAAVQNYLVFAILATVFLLSSGGDSGHHLCRAGERQVAGGRRGRSATRV